MWNIAKAVNRGKFITLSAYFRKEESFKRAKINQKTMKQ